VRDGGAGAGTLIGGDGVDTFLFGPGSQVDTIMDYEAGENIDLVGSLNGNGAGMILARVGDDLRITSPLDAGDRIVLVDFYANGLTQVRLDGTLFDAP
jgi:Ca2+-binding RTX toxin-like protein